MQVLLKVPAAVPLLEHPLIFEAATNYVGLHIDRAVLGLSYLTLIIGRFQGIIVN